MTRRPAWDDSADFDKELHKAASFGDIEAVRKRLETVGDINARDGFGHTCLWRAVASGSLAAVKIIIETGASVHIAEATGLSPLCVAVSRGDIEIANLLLDQGADARVLGSIDESLVHVALLRCLQHERGADLVRRLISLGADPRKPNKFGKTPAQLAESIPDCPFAGRL